MKEKHSLQKFENRMYRKIFESKKGEVSEQFMILHIEELNELCRLTVNFCEIQNFGWVSLRGRIYRKEKGF
jgi:hypothetical protein